MVKMKVYYNKEELEEINNLLKKKIKNGKFKLFGN